MRTLKSVLLCLLFITTTQANHLHRLAKDHAFVFFFASTCKYCHQFAPIVQSISKEYGFTIFDFSFDQKPMPGFPNPGAVMQSIYDTYYGNKPAVAPVLLLQNINTLEFYRIAQGDIMKTAVLKKLNEKAEAIYGQ